MRMSRIVSTQEISGFMTPNEAGAGLGQSLPADRQEQPGPPCPLVLELIIAGTEPLTGTLRPAGRAVPVAFHGWIDLMAAISSLGEPSPREG
jgi:hypothetical protein